MSQIQAGIPTRQEVFDAFVSMLEGATGRPVGKGRAPFKDGDVNVAEDLPYAIVHPVPGGMFEGSPFSRPEEDATFEFQTVAVALRDDQAEWLADQIRNAVLARDSSGSFVYAMTISRGTITDRESASPPGGQEPRDNIYSVPESYFVRVSA